MNQRLLHTPQGVRDIYGSECQKKNVLKDRLHQVLKHYGYHDIETPTFEFFDIFNHEKGTVSDTEMYKFFDRNNNTLVLRPDMTPSIARSVAKYYEDETLPLRLSYLGNTYLNKTNYQGKLTEFTQIGAELVNDNSSSADAEIIAMIADSFLAAGLKEFRIDIGQVEFYKGLVEEAGLDQEDEEKLRDLIENKNSFGLEKFLESLSLPDSVNAVFLSFTDLYGGREILDKVRKMTDNVRSLKAIERLEKVFEILSAYGYDKYISIDLGMLTQYNYYTGVIFKGYTYGTGDAIAKGGRYDSLLSQFGKESPSVGFVITIDELLLALERQQIGIPTEEGMLFLFDRDQERKAIKEASILRKEGKNLTLMKKYEERQLSEYHSYCKAYGISEILYLKSDGTTDTWKAE
ncbi:MAG: ATP phosphoribosyltransferase regulatory subunit [Lachnospiraceae bacterium]|nr:ATP phosphoribosyltransferase regulatory subunit [Lachnospiraceae bacterium]